MKTLINKLFLAIMVPVYTYLFAIMGVLSLFFTPVHAHTLDDEHNPQVYSLNKKPVVVDEGKDFSFHVVGHMYGVPNGKTPFPAATILANIDYLLDTKNTLFFGALGDIYDLQNKEYIANLKKSFINKLSFPFFNAVGNHDIVDREMYMEQFNLPRTYFHFSIRQNVFVFVDTEQELLTGEQRKFLDAISTKYRGYKNLFVFSHQLFWKKEHPDAQFIRSFPLKIAFDENSPFVKYIADSFNVENTYIFSGDINREWLLPLLYAQKLNMKFYAVGNGDTENDALLTINVDANDNTRFELYSLTGKSLGQPSNYDIDHNDYYITNLDRLAFIQKVFYFIKYPYHLFALFLLTIFILFVFLIVRLKASKSL